LFEKKLIQYNVEGQITVYPNQILIVTPVSIIDVSLPEANYSSNFNVGRIA